MTNARETLAMRTTIHAGLRPEDIPRINFAALLNASADAIARGWTGQELASIALEGLYTGDVRDLGAVMHANLRSIAGQDPPREITPSPPDITSLRAERAAAVAEAERVDHAAWVARIKNLHDPRLGAGYGDAGMPLPGATAGPGATQPPEPNSGTTPTKSDAQRAAQ